LNEKCRPFLDSFSFYSYNRCSSLQFADEHSLELRVARRLHLIRVIRVVDLNRFAEQITFALMKLILAVVVYLVIGLILGSGIFLAAVKGSPWVLIVGAVVYIVAFGKIGCTSH
jgi:hypothetical protein